MSSRVLDHALEAAIADGLMTRAQAEDVDAFADGLTARFVAGEITMNDGLRLAAARGTADGLAKRARDKRARKERGQ